MKIGIDLRSLQTGHKYRGIGEVAKQTTNRILAQGVEDGHEFIFYEYDDDDPKTLLDIPKGIESETVKLGYMPEGDKANYTKGQKFKRAYNDLYGSPIPSSLAKKSDVFLQFDYAFGVPKSTRTVLVKHDFIPYIFWSKYFESALVPFKNKALRTTLRTLFANHKYMRVLKRGLRNAGAIVAVSNSTKNDAVRLFGTNPKKIKVAHLGVDVNPAKTTDIDTPDNMPTKPYLLFVGAGDARRRVDDLVAAFNNLKADGHDIQLVLVGENFKKPTDIPNVTVRKEVLQSSYKNDILTMGYVSDEVKQKLFREALAYVYPTRYEGFGIPVIEAMLMECPIIVYKNSSIPEVGGDHALYVQDWEGIVEEVKNLISLPDSEKKRRLKEAKKHAEGFTWDKTAAIIYEELTSRKR